MNRIWSFASWDGTPPSFLTARHALFKTVDVNVELRGIYDSFAGNVPFKNPRSAKHCVLHIRDLTGRLTSHHSTGLRCTLSSTR